MPRDDWKRAADRAKYGPVRYDQKAKKKAKKHRRQARKAIRALSEPGTVPCPRCGSYEIEKSVQTFKDGTQHIRVECKCGKFFKWAPQT